MGAAKTVKIDTTIERELGRLRLNHITQLLRAPSEPGLGPLATELLRIVLDAGEIRASDLASRLFVTKTSISRYVNGMLDDGLLEQRGDPSDGRATLLSVSSVGKHELLAREDRRTHVLMELCADWSGGDMDTFTKLLRRLNDASSVRRETIRQQATN